MWIATSYVYIHVYNKCVSVYILCILYMYVVCTWVGPWNSKGQLWWGTSELWPREFLCVLLLLLNFSFYLGSSHRSSNSKLTITRQLTILFPLSEPYTFTDVRNFVPLYKFSVKLCYSFALRLLYDQYCGDCRFNYHW